MFLLHFIVIFPMTTAYDFFPETTFLEEASRLAEEHLALQQNDLHAMGLDA
jgi:hypothetical protein